jgi:ABC-type lipoprotein export system ATPase subunit
MNSPILHLREIRKEYVLPNIRIPVLRGVDLDVAEGEWVALLGASGSGKTTLLNILGLLERPDRGATLEFEGKNLLSLSSKGAAQFRRDNLGFVFQAYHLLPELNVRENVRIAAMIANRQGGATEERILGILEQVGLSHRTEHRPNELSGGEQQRVAIARSLVNSPRLLLADEPTGNLDSATGSEILDIFVRMRALEEKPRTILMVTHDREVAALADRVIHLRDGVIVST